MVLRLLGMRRPDGVEVGTGRDGLAVGFNVLVDRVDMWELLRESAKELGLAV